MKNVKPGHAQPIAVLDPGHYGSKYNPGAVAGYFESEQMWKLTQYQKTAMEAYGIKVILTRTQKSQNPDLVDRGKMAADADTFESLHSNAEKTGKVDAPLGIYFVDDNCGEIDEDSKELAKLMAGVVADTMGTSGKGKIWTRSSSRDRDGDGYNDDYYGVLRGCHAVGTTGFIMEHSYHTNPAAAAWLMDDANLKKLAQAKADAYAKWFGLEKPASKPKEIKATEPAYHKDDTLKGTYKVTADSGLNIRNGAGTKPNKYGQDKSVLVAIPKGTKVSCWGYYTDVSGVKWLSVQFTYSGTVYTGFACEKHLKKV